MPVGLVTLISVTKPPMTSRPTNSMPLRGERRADLAGEPAVALVERPADALGAGGEIAAVVVARTGMRARA